MTGGPKMPQRATCTNAPKRGARCSELATGVIRATSDGYIYAASCEGHQEQHCSKRLRYEHWGEVYGPAGPAHSGGADYRRDASQPVVEYLP